MSEPLTQGEAALLVLASIGIVMFIWLMMS